MRIIGDRDGAGRLGSGASLLADIVFAGGCRDQLPRVIAKAPIVGNRAVIVVFAVIVGEDEVEQCRLLDDARCGRGICRYRSGTALPASQEAPGLLATLAFGSGCRIAG